MEYHVLVKVDDAGKKTELSPGDVVGWTVHLVLKDGTVHDKALVRGYGCGLFNISPSRCVGVTHVPIAELAAGSKTLDEVPRAATMTVDVGNRGQSRSYEGVRVTEVTIVARCPRCGGPRGPKRAGRIIEDGAHYWVHNWDNPCGHTDMYGDVLVEAGVHLPDRMRDCA